MKRVITFVITLAILTLACALPGQAPVSDPSATLRTGTQSPTSPCGDGVCGAVEQANPNLCPADCATLETALETDAPSAVVTSSPPGAPTLTPTAAAPTPLPPTTASPTPTRLPLPTPAGEPFSHLPAGQAITIHFVHMLDASTGWAIGGAADVGDHVLFTEDGSQTWRDVTPPEPAPETSESPKQAFGAFLDRQTAWVTYARLPGSSGREGLWRTQDGGQNWEWSGLSFGTGGDGYHPFLETVDAQHGWFLAEFLQLGAGAHYVPVLLFTGDGGLTWSEGDRLGGAITGMDFADPQTGWVTGEVLGPYAPPVPPELQWTTDGGLTWQTEQLPLPESAPDLLTNFPYCGTFSPALFSPQDGVLVARCFEDELRNRAGPAYLYATTDGGQTWNTHELPIGAGEFAWVNEQVGWLVGEGQVYQTTDGGQTWKLMTTVSWEAQLSPISDQIAWAVARSGEEIALVQTSNGGRTWALLEPRIHAE